MAVSGDLTLHGIPPPAALPSDIAVTINGPHEHAVVVHHVFDTPLRVILEMAPPRLERISVTLTSP